MVNGVQPALGIHGHAGAEFVRNGAVADPLDAPLATGAREPLHAGVCAELFRIDGDDVYGSIRCDCQ